MIALAVTVAALLAAPATWATETLGHATSSTFPAGGSGQRLDGRLRRPGGPGGAGGHRSASRAAPARLRRTAPGAGAAGAGAPGAAASGAAGAGGGRAEPVRRLLGGHSAGVRAPGGFGGGGGGGMFGGDNASLQAAVTYAKAHGGGTIGVESQESAAAAIISGNADVAGLGGFSGRESTVSAPWLAMEVRDGRLRWILGRQPGAAGSAACGGDSRQGSAAALAVAEKVGRKVTFTSGWTR